MEVEKNKCTEIPARIWPRDVMDGLLILLSFFSVHVLAVLAAAAAAHYGARWLGFPSAAKECTLIVLTGFLLFWFSHTVWSLRLSKSGIHFVRLFGEPKFLRWEDVTEIAEAPRRELILNGWLAPRFPMREMTASLSASRHFRVRWHGGYCYYPPADAENFLGTVNEYRSKVSEPPL
jgi:hypothetical protein